MPLDGYVAGPAQSREDPVGVRGLELHEWHWHAGEPGHEADAGPRDELLQRRGAYVMGRNMFGPVHAPIEMAGGTTFHFVTAGFDAAWEQARAVAGDQELAIAGGASTVQQALAAGAIDELVLDLVPVLLRRGERLFDGVADPGLEPVDVVHSPHATHVRYRVGR
jgi:dihydrofolate reductase